MVDDHFIKEGFTAPSRNKHIDAGRQGEGVVVVGGGLQCKFRDRPGVCRLLPLPVCAFPACSSQLLLWLPEWI
jgi:hypothetical protein